MQYTRFWAISSFVLATAGWSSVSCASTVVVSLSDSISGSVQSVSDSVSRVSKSSSNTVTNLAEGDYRVVAVAQADTLPGKMRLTLQAMATPNDPALYLFVTRPELDQSGVQAGQVITASKRPYGMAFSPQHHAKPFAVVLDDQWLKELSTHALAS